MKYFVTIENPLTVNHIYATSRSGHRFMTSTHVDKKTKKLVEGGKQYRGEWKKQKIGWLFVPGRLDEVFRKAGIPNYPKKTKVVIEAAFTWPSNTARDCSNFQKPIEDAFQDGGFIPNDSHILWQNIDFQTVKNVYKIELTIYEKESENVR